MGQYTSYYLYQRYESRDGQRAIPSIPSYYSIDGDGTMERVIKMENDPNCGYVPPPAEPIYRWYQLPISQDYVCDSCGYVPPTPTGETIYRWVESGTTCVGYDKWNRSIEQYSEDSGVTWYNTNPPVYSATSLIEVDSTDCGVSYRWIDLNPSTDYYCSGTTKYYKQQKQKSYDGTTWENVTPAEYQWGGSAETESMDCGYIPPTTIKLKSTYSDSTVKFAECDASSAITQNEVIKENLVSVEIGDCVTTIGDWAFAFCGSLTSATIPNSVTSIGDRAFYNSTSLTSVTIPNSVTSMDYAFYYCTGLISVTIESGVTNIGIQAFRDCTSLTSITIPNSVTSIGDMAFTHCKSLTSVTIPDSVTTIGGSAFIDSLALTNVTIGSGVTTIGGGAFANCPKLTSATIPDSVTYLGGGAFNYCTGLTSVTIGSGVTSIGDSTFYVCRSLTSVAIPSGVTSIGGSAFRYCSSLTSVTVNAVTPPTLGEYAFDGSACPILVPSGSLTAYQTAWSDYSSRIQAIP